MRIRFADGREAEGASAELLAPKWFDKNPSLSNEDNFDQLRTAIRLTTGVYQSGEHRTAWGHFAHHHLDHICRASAVGLNTLTANFGPALIDRAALDALCRAEQISFYQAMQQNPGGLQPTDLALVNLLGITHVERNGHHYVNGMADLPAAEQANFLSAHPDLYEHSHGATRLAIRAGMIEVASLVCPGYASQAFPDWQAMRQLAG